jgi:hypothetical protein
MDHFPKATGLHSGYLGKVVEGPDGEMLENYTAGALASGEKIFGFFSKKFSYY